MSDINGCSSYSSVVKKVYDGDTVTLNIFLGFNVTLINQKVRLYGINCPEVRGDSKEEGIKSRDYVRNAILNKDVTLYTFSKRNSEKRDKYGRWIGYIVCDGVNINDDLVDKGLAVRKEYK